MSRHHPTRRKGSSPTRRYEIRISCVSGCRPCREYGYHVESRTGDLDKAKRDVLYLQREDQSQTVYIQDSWVGRVDFKGYDVHIWKSIDGCHKLEAWGDPSYKAPTVLSPARGTFSLVFREEKRCRVIASGLTTHYLWILRDAACGLVPQEDGAAFGRWAVRQLRAASKENPESIELLGDKLCSVADWPGGLSVEELLSRPAA